ncbi:hypothetical protein F4678DRAFT_99993 [Xylaria arbuscula]|nr:hypothetical protein F4678DRAFT_99993 [Xylaria arbuscula]
MPNSLLHSCRLQRLLSLSPAGFNQYHPAQLPWVFILGLAATVARHNNLFGPVLDTFPQYLHIMPPVASSYHTQVQVQTDTKGKSPNCLEGTGPYGATLKQGLLPKPITDAQKPPSFISIRKSEIEIQGDVEDSVVGNCVHIEELIEFEIESQDIAIKDSTDDVTVINNTWRVPNAALSMAVTQSVVACEIKTKGIKFGKRRC